MKLKLSVVYVILNIFFAISSSTVAYSSARYSSTSVGCYAPNTETIVAYVSNPPKGTVKIGYLIEFVGIGGTINGLVKYPSANSINVNQSQNFLFESSKDFSQTPYRVTAYFYNGFSNSLQNLESITSFC